MEEHSYTTIEDGGIKMLWIIWLVFAVLFLVLAYYHWKASRRAISPIQIHTRPYNEPDSPIKVTARIAGTGIDKPLEDFVSDFNDYLADYNKSSRRQNTFQACGYFLASLMAIFTIFFVA